MMKNAKHIAGLMLSIPFEEYLQEKTSFNIQKPMISLFGGRSYIYLYTSTHTRNWKYVEDNLRNKNKQILFAL